MGVNIFRQLNHSEPEKPPRVYFWRRLIVYSLFPIPFIAAGLYANGFDYLFSKAFLMEWLIYLPILIGMVLIISLGEFIHLKMWQAKKRRREQSMES